MKRTFSAPVLALALSVGLLLGAASGLRAEETDDVDALFDSPEAGTIEEQGEKPKAAGEGAQAQQPPAAAPVNLLDQFTREPLTFYGSVSTALGGLAGYKELPPFDRPMATDMDYSGYANFTDTLSFRARPDPSTSLQGSFAVAYPSGDKGDFVFTVPEVFVTYVLYDRLFFRIGKQTITWGNGRIYDDTNLTEGAENGYSFKLTVPVGQAAFTAVAMDQPAWRETTTAGVKELNYAGQMTLPIGPVEFLAMGLIPSVKRRNEAVVLGHDEGSASAIKGVLGAKTTVWSVDFFHESLMNRMKQYTALSGFFKEWSDPQIQFYGEYRYKHGPDICGPDITTDHQTSLNLLWKKFFHPQVEVGVRWNQAWRDNSGYVIPGLKLTTIPKLTIGMALPVYYGNRYSAAAVDYAEDVDSQFRKAAFVMTATLDLSF